MEADPDYVAIAAGRSHGIALRSDGSLQTWGSNIYGERSVPAGANDFEAISAGTYFSLALRADGSIVGWGLNSDGQTNVPAGVGFTSIDAGHGFALAIHECRIAF